MAKETQPAKKNEGVLTPLKNLTYRKFCDTLETGKFFEIQTNTTTKGVAMSLYFMLGFLIGAIIVLCFAASFLVCFIFWTLAQSNLFFTVLKEGYTKAIMSNGKPVRLVMRSEHHRFRNQLKKSGEGHPWDIVEYAPPPVLPLAPSKTRKARARLAKALRFASGMYLFDNLVWVGFPPTYKIHTYTFHWSSRIQNPNREGMKQEQRSEHIAHILAPQQEVYFALIEDAKTSELMPVNASVALTVQIVNPFKALFNTHQWLKTVVNQIEPDIREVIGGYTFEALTESDKTASNELETDKGFKKRRHTLEKEYGVKIILAQFRSIEPSGKLADEITKTSLRKYTAEQEVKEAEQRVRVAEQEARKIDILARATEERLRRELGVVMTLGPEAVEIRKMELLPKGLMVYGRGESRVMPTLPLSPQNKNTP